MGACQSDLTAEQREMYESNLKKWTRIYEKDLAKLKLSSSEMKTLFEPFQDMDFQGTGKLNELKWYKYMTPSVLRPDEDFTEKFDAKAATSPKGSTRTLLGALGLSSARVVPEAGADGQNPQAGGTSEDAKAAGGIEAAKGATTPVPLALTKAGSSSGVSRDSRGSSVALIKSGSSSGVSIASPFPVVPPPKSKRKYARRLFRLFAREGHNECDFGEFATSCVELLPPLLHCLIKFAFLVYDTDGSGSLSAGKWTGASEISPESILELAQEVVASLPKKKLSRKSEGLLLEQELVLDAAILKAASPDFLAGAAMRAAGALQEAEAVRHIYESEFGRFALRNPALLFPAARLQAALRLRLGGTTFYRNATLRRLRVASLSGGSGLGAADRAMNDAALWVRMLRDTILKAKKRDNADMVAAAVRSMSQASWVQPTDLPADEKATPSGKPTPLKKKKSSKNVEAEAEPEVAELASASELSAVRAQFIVAFGDFAAMKKK